MALDPEVRLERFLASQNLTPAVRLEYFLAGAAGYGLAALQNESAAISAGGTAVASIPDAAGSVPFQSIVTAIDPVQEGTGGPAPDNVRPISGRTAATLKIGAEYPTADQEYTSSFPQTVYGGTFDWVRGKLTVNMAMADLGELTYTYVSLSGGRSEFIAKLDDIKPHGSVLVPINAISSMYKAVSYNASWVSGDMSYARDPNGGGNLREVAFINSSYTDAEEFKTAMSGQSLVYELDNPIEIDLPDLTILANSGENNIWSDAGNVLALEYKQDPEASAAEIKSLIAPVLPEMKADANLVANDFRIVGNTLYKITANIAAGGTLTPGSNCTATTVAAQLKALL